MGKMAMFRHIRLECSAACARRINSKRSICGSKERSYPFIRIPVRLLPVRLDCLLLLYSRNESCRVFKVELFQYFVGELDSCKAQPGSLVAKGFDDICVICFKEL